MTTDPDSHKENGDAIEGDRIAIEEAIRTWMMRDNTIGDHLFRER